MSDKWARPNKSMGSNAKKIKNKVKEKDNTGITLEPRNYT